MLGAFVYEGYIFNWLLTGIKSRRKYPNFGIQGSVINGLLAGLKSRRKCPNFGLHGSVIDQESTKESENYRLGNLCLGNLYNCRTRGCP